MSRYGIIGFPLTHTFSPAYFLEKFKILGITTNTYKAYPLQSIQEFTKLITLENLSGLNVTIPYKQSVLPFIDQLDSTAHETGAVNTLKIVDGKVFGYNTDTYGFGQSLLPHYTSHYKNALILGTGGASKAVEYVFKKLKINYKLVSRSPKHDNEIGYNDISENIMRTHFLIVNTTPLGMSPNTHSLPLLDYEQITSNHFLYDLVYTPEETLFLKKGRDQGAKTIGGLKMLELQAEKSWEIWNKNSTEKHK